MTVPAMTAVARLPVAVLDHPHWRVNYRPASYVAKRLAAVSDCLEVLQKNRVSLRGWDFPHVPSRETARAYGDSWIAGWSDFNGHLEYWRFYQSTQFLYLGSVREVTTHGWREKLRRVMEKHADDDIDLDAVPGFLSVTNAIYSITEFFEFAARLAQAQVYADTVTVNISLKGVAGFMLAADENRIWSSDYVSRQPDLHYETTISPAELIGSVADHAIACAVWLFDRFGWRRPNIDAIRTTQQKLLTRQL